MGAWGPNRVGRGNCWNCGQPGHFSRYCPFQETNKLRERERARERAEPKGLSSVPPCHQRPACSPRARTLRGTHDHLGLLRFKQGRGSGCEILSRHWLQHHYPEPSSGSKDWPRSATCSRVSGESHDTRGWECQALPWERGIWAGSRRKTNSPGNLDRRHRVGGDSWVWILSASTGCQIVSASEGELQLFIPDMSTASKAELADSTRSNTRQCFRVAVEDTVVIPANSELITVAKVLDECSNGGVGILEPAMELVGRSLVQMEGNNSYPASQPYAVSKTSLQKHTCCSLRSSGQTSGSTSDSGHERTTRAWFPRWKPNSERASSSRTGRIVSRRPFASGKPTHRNVYYDHKSHTNSYREGEKVWLYNPQKRSMAVQPTKEKRPKPKIRDSMGRALDGNQACYGRGLLHPEKSPRRNQNFVHHDRLKTISRMKQLHLVVVMTRGWLTRSPGVLGTLRDNRRNQFYSLTK